MKTQGALQTFLQRLGPVVLMLFLICVTACTPGHHPPMDTQGAIEKADQLSLERARNAFRNGEFEHAYQVLEPLTQLSRNDLVKRAALYELACIRLTLAQLPGEFREAMVLWDDWSGRMPPDFAAEDPRMLGPFLHRMIPAEHESKNGETIEETNPYQKLLEAKEAEIENLRLELKQKEKKIRRLTHQVEGLEAIHRKIQEKKKEISSP
jgi:hypothetical protein